jgi:hypothetical protein
MTGIAAAHYQNRELTQHNVDLVLTEWKMKARKLLERQGLGVPNEAPLEGAKSAHVRPPARRAPLAV